MKSSRLMQSSLKFATENGRPPAEIKRFRGQYHFLSNFYQSPVKHDELTFPTVEHAFQAAKSNDMEYKRSLLNNKNPVIAKRLGRRVKLRSDWEKCKVDIMYEILSIKFKPGNYLSSQLIQTENSQLVEGNMWHDQFWGSCQCNKHHDKPGKNVLGKHLMRLRDELATTKKQNS